MVLKNSLIGTKNMKIHKNLKIGIVGHGFVGKATDWGFNKKVKKYIVDPKLKTTIDELSCFEPEIIFICVPTPMNNDGSQDSSVIEKVIKDLSKKCRNSIKVVKSTVLPSILEKLTQQDQNIIYNPEFLREKHANEDFINSKIIIFGGSKNICTKVAEAYKLHSRCKTRDYIFTDLFTASFIKYSLNTYLATKVVFFNELHAIFKSLNVSDSWNSVISTLSKDERIGHSHMEVPGHDGKEGFGGACFPKDSVALVKYASEIGIDMSVLKTVIKTNNKIRSKYDALDERETEQNVSFDDKI